MSHLHRGCVREVLGHNDHEPDQSTYRVDCLRWRVEDQQRLLALGAADMISRRDAIKLAIAGALSPLLSLLPERETTLVRNMPISAKADPQFGMFNELDRTVEWQGFVIPPQSNLAVPRHMVKGYGHANSITWRREHNRPLPVQKEAGK